MGIRVSGIVRDPTLAEQGEFRMLLIREKVTRDLNSGFGVMAQTSLGEILRPKPGAWRLGDDGRPARPSYAELHSVSAVAKNLARASS